MFYTEVKADGGFLSWLLQQAAALTVPAIWSLATSPFVATIQNATKEPLRSIIGIVWYFFIGWGLAFALARGIHRAFPRASLAGLWIWPLPLLIFTAVFIHDCGIFPMRQVMSEFFYPGANGEAWWAFFVFTYPTCSCIVYSLGMLFARGRAASGSTTVAA